MRPPARTPAVVLGLGVNGLGTARALGRAGIPAIAVSSGHPEPSWHTRYARRVHCPEMHRNPAALVDCLVRLGRDLTGPSVLFPSGDETLQVVSAEREVLASWYRFPFPDHETVTLVLDKHRFYRWAVANGQPIAPTWFPADPADLDQVLAQIRFPALIKPSVATPAWRALGLKVIAAADAASLRARFAEAFAVHRDLVVQEVVPGPDSALQFSLTYFDEHGTDLAMFTGRKLRQWVPHYGISSLAESRRDERIAQLTREVLGALGYRGYGSVEFKWDPRDDRFRMTEVTARTWYPHALSEHCGINLPALAWRHLVEGSAAPLRADYPDGVKWMDEVGDLRSAWYYHRAGELPVREWLGSLRGPRHLAHFSADDPRPGLALAGRLAVAPLHLAARRLRRLAGGGR